MSFAIKEIRKKCPNNLESLLEFFVAGTTARTAAELTGINRNSANLFYNKLRQIIERFTYLLNRAVSIAGLLKKGKEPLTAVYAWVRDKPKKS